MCKDQTPAIPSGDLSSRISRQEEELTRLLEWIRAVDAKTPSLIAIGTLMVGAAAAVFPEREKFSCIALLWLALATAGPLAVLYHCWLATHPQTKGPERSLIYFGAIASLSIGAYSERVRTQNEEDYYADLITQSHRNAEIAKNKYARLRAATTWLLASIPVWAIALYLQYKG